jgi:cysteinyl-tRNA synthetase
MNEDAAALGVQRPDHEPRATEYVPQMLDLIGKLEERPGLQGQRWRRQLRGAQVPGYGKLSGKSLDDLRAGERVDVNTGKRDPLDFVLWKPPSRASRTKPSGIRPGAGPSGLAHRVLGHVQRPAGRAFRHPRRRSGPAVPAPRERDRPVEGAHQHTFVNYWMHNGFVRVDNEKMSKSLGNFFTIRDVLKNTTPKWCASSSCARTTAAR